MFVLTNGRWGECSGNLFKVNTLAFPFGDCSGTQTTHFSICIDPPVQSLSAIFMIDGLVREIDDRA